MGDMPGGIPLYPGSRWAACSCDFLEISRTPRNRLYNIIYIHIHTYYTYDILYIYATHTYIYIWYIYDIYIYIWYIYTYIYVWYINIYVLYYIYKYIVLYLILHKRLAPQSHFWRLISGMKLVALWHTSCCSKDWNDFITCPQSTPPEKVGSEGVWISRTTFGVWFPGDSISCYATVGLSR